MTFFFAPWALAIDFSSDLDISAQGQAMMPGAFYQNAFSHYSLKSTKEILIKNFHRKIATWPYYYCLLVDVLTGICILSGI